MGGLFSILMGLVSRQETIPLVIRNVDPQDGRGVFDIVYVPYGDYVDRMCRRLGTRAADSGESVNTMDINGCYDYGNKIMYLSSPSERLLRHEWCHRNNPPSWDGNSWIYPQKNLNGIGSLKCQP